MVSDNDTPEVYIFQDRDGEEVPEDVEEITFKPGIRALPDAFCCNKSQLRKVTLPKGLRAIGNNAFEKCKNLLEINEIPSTVQHIGKAAFWNCQLLTKVEFEDSISSPSHELRTIIGHGAFNYCVSLQRIKPPSSVSIIEESAFVYCEYLIEANLSTSSVRKIPNWAFLFCRSLQTASLPNTVEQICLSAFYHCSALVTVVVPIGSKSIRVGKKSFADCRRLANIVLPSGSTAEANAFDDCANLYHRFGTESADEIVARLIGRFDGLDLHRLCYQHPRPTTQTLRQYLRQCVEETDKNLFEDVFGMTPFHILFSTPEPNTELLEVLLDSLPNQILKLKDVNDKRPVDYLINNWTDETKSLLHRTLQKSIVDRVDRWGATSWMEAMQGKVQGIHAEDDKEQRIALCNGTYSALEHYENQEVTSILEMALWKWKLSKSGWANNRSKRPALDREECRSLSRVGVVIPPIATFLGVERRASDWH